MTIALQGDRLTGRIERASLRQVLVELRRHAGIQSEFIDPADDDTVSQLFDATPLAEAIDRLLNGRSFALVHVATSAVTNVSAPTPSLRLLILPRTVAIATQSVTIAQQGDPTAVATNRVPGSVARPSLPVQAASEHEASVLDEFTRAMVDPDESSRARAQERFEQALEGEYQFAAGTPQPRR